MEVVILEIIQTHKIISFDYNRDEFIFDPDSEAEPDDEGIQVGSTKDDSD